MRVSHSHSRGKSDKVRGRERGRLCFFQQRSTEGKGRGKLGNCLFGKEYVGPAL